MTVNPLTCKIRVMWKHNCGGSSVGGQAVLCKKIEKIWWGEIVKWEYIWYCRQTHFHCFRLF